MKHDRFESLDLFWGSTDSKNTFRPKICYIYVQGEYGFIPYIIGSSVEGRKKPTVEILSKDMAVEPFNRMPNLVRPCWTATQVSSNTCFVCISNFPSIDMMPDANPEVWGQTYPLMMDLLLFLKSHGCKQVNFISSMNTSDATQASDLLIYDMYNDIRPDTDLLLALPAWGITHLWQIMGGQSCVICVVQDQGQYIDQEAFNLLEEYIIAIGLPYDKVHRDRLTQVLLSVRENMEQLSSTFDLFDDEAGDLL